jgi:hypothetical protein
VSATLNVLIQAGASAHLALQVRVNISTSLRCTHVAARHFKLQGKTLHFCYLSDAVLLVNAAYAELCV